MAAGVAGRARATGQPGEPTRGRPQGRRVLSRAPDRRRQAARRDHAAPLTALWPQVYDIDRLREAYYGRTRDAAPGIEGQTWAASGEARETHLRALADRLQRGASRAQPVERVSLPKPEGRQRPIGTPPREAKIVQRATGEGRNALYEAAVLGFADGLRPGRSPPPALEAVTGGREKRQGNGGLAADMRGGFAARDHAWRVRCGEHRLGDRRGGRHRRQWRQAGGLAEGPWPMQAAGTPPGGSVRPRAANSYRPSVLALGAERWRRRHARGAGIIVRSGDDCLVGVEPRDAAERFWADRRERCQTCNRALPPEKTRRLEWGRCAAERRQRRGQGKPEPGDCLGFPHICSKTRTGQFTGRRQTIAQRRRQTLQEVKTTLRQRRPWPLPQPGAGRRSVVLGQ
jgi:RNA-directed DNA polymerase